MRTPIKLISFDLWGTLLKSNPSFHDQRSKLVADALNHSDYDQVALVMRKIDNQLDACSEKTGDDFDGTARLQAVVKELGYNPGDFSNTWFADLQEQINDAFLALTPSFTEENALGVLSDLKKMGMNIAILSNTGFIKGEIIKLALEKLGVLKHIDYTIFSNEVGFAKPHTKIFECLVNISRTNRNNIMHVGDNVTTDYYGARNYGIHSLLIDFKESHTGAQIEHITSLSVLPSYIKKYTTTHSTLSLYTLHKEDEAIITQSLEKFDVVSYSKFKYGDGNIALQYGYQLADKFINTIISKEDITIEDLIITTSPFKAIPKGSSGIVQGFKAYLNRYLLSKNQKSVSDMVILKQDMFAGDYGTFTAAERELLMNKNSLHVYDNFVKNKSLIIIDDVRITGSHEKNLLDFFSDKEIKNIYFLYVAQMEQDQAQSDPQIESRMNNAWITDLDKLLSIINGSSFLLNARICKFILSHPNTAELSTFLANLESKKIYDIYVGSIGDGYASMPIYQENFLAIEHELKKRRILIKDNFEINKPGLDIDPGTP